MLGPIYQCDNGHQLCDKCQPKVKGTCPTCRLSKGKITVRNRVLEEARDTDMVVPCNFTGCNHVCLAREMADHQTVCPHLTGCTACHVPLTEAQLANHVCPRRLVACPLRDASERRGCDDLVPHADRAQHLLQRHAPVIPCRPSGNLHLKVMPHHLIGTGDGGSWTSVLLYNDEPYYAFVKFDVRCEVFAVTVAGISDDPALPDVYCTLRTKGGGDAAEEFFYRGRVQRMKAGHPVDVTRSLVVPGPAFRRLLMYPDLPTSANATAIVRVQIVFS